MSTAVVPADDVMQHGAIAPYQSNEIVDMLKKQLKAAQRMSRYWKSKSESLETQLVESRNESKALAAKVKFRPGIRNVTCLGGYTLAIKRNRSGHVGAASAAQLVAGDVLRGGLHDKKIVLQYEHKAACAKRCRAAQVIAEFKDDLHAVGDSIFKTFEVWCYKGDATNQEAIDKEKVHTSLVSGLLYACPKNHPDHVCVGPDGKYDVGAFSQFVQQIRESGDLQIVKDGSGAETFQLMLHEFASVKAPTIEQRCKSQDPSVISLYLHGLDNGPDNQGMMKRIAYECLPVDTCMFAVVWCTFHQAHLIAKCQLEAMMDCHFTDKGLSVSYFAAISSIVNVWRSTGTIAKMCSASIALFGFDTTVNKLPGRPLRGRWGAIESAEGFIIKARHELPAVFSRVLDKKKQAKREKLNDNDDWQEKAKAFRDNSLAVHKCPVFFVLVMVSKCCRGPLDHFFLWRHKRIKKHNRRIEENRDKGMCYFRPTPLSDVVLTQDSAAVGDWNALLNTPWTCKPWSDIGLFIGDHFPDDAERAVVTADAMCFSVSQILLLLASWQFRFTDRFKLWKQICTLAAKDPYEECPDRMSVAQSWISSPDCCLSSASRDIPRKIKKLFAEELQLVSVDGRVPLRLFELLLMIRAQLPLDVQDIEGMNSVLQIIGKRAPKLAVPLAPDRIQLKKGTPISAEECTALHDQVVVSMQSHEQSHRHLPAIPSKSPPEHEHVLCKHGVGRVSMLAVRYAHAMYAHRVLGASTVWSGKRCFTCSFIMCWSYFTGMWVATGSCEGGVFSLDHPVVILNLASVLSDDMRLHKAGVKTIRMYSTSLTWRSLLTADLGTKIKHVDVKPSTGRKPPAPKAAHIVPAAAAPSSSVPEAAPPAADEAQVESAQDPLVQKNVVAVCVSFFRVAFVMLHVVSYFAFVLI